MPTGSNRTTCFSVITPLVAGWGKRAGKAGWGRPVEGGGPETVTGLPPPLLALAGRRGRTGGRALLAVVGVESVPGRAAPPPPAGGGARGPTFFWDPGSGAAGRPSCCRRRARNPCPSPR